jgi:hypothetical protein
MLAKSKIKHNKSDGVKLQLQFNVIIKLKAYGYGKCQDLKLSASVVLTTGLSVSLCHLDR